MNNKNSIFLNCEFNLNKLNINCYKYSKIDGKINRQIGSQIQDLSPSFIYWNFGICD